MKFSIQLNDSGALTEGVQHALLQVKNANLNQTAIKYNNKILRVSVVEFLSDADFLVLIGFIKQCNGIKKLDLSKMPKKYLLKDELKNALDLMRDLESISLEGMGLDSSDIINLASLFKGLGIKSLSLHANNIADIGLKNLLHIIEYDMPNIQHVNVSFNNISPIGCDYLIKYLKIKNTTFAVAGNHINEEQAIFFANAFREKIDLRNPKPIFKPTPSENEAQEPNMVLDGEVYDREIYTRFEDVINDQQDDNQMLTDFWKTFLQELNEFYIKHTITELFSDSLDENLMMTDFKEVNAATSFGQIIEQFKILHSKKKFLDKTLPILIQVDFSEQKINIFRSRIVYQLIKISKEIVRYHNASFEVFKDMHHGLHKFLSMGSILALKQQRAELYQSLKQHGECTNIEQFLKYSDLLQDSIAQYRNLNLDWHEDLDLSQFNSQINKVKSALTNQTDNRIKASFEQVLQQFNQEHSAFASQITINEYTDEGKATLRIEANHLLYSDIERDINARLNKVKQIIIVCKAGMLLDRDITLPGINLTIFSNHTYLTPGIKTINLSPVFEKLPKSKDGKKGTKDGEANQANCGENGDIGLQGQASGNFNLMTHNATNIARQLNIRANGNPGGDGGNAGDGIDGKIGEHGDTALEPSLPRNVDHDEDYIAYVKGGKGKPGERGGDSGSPGGGGLGGAFGYINIYDLSTLERDSKHGQNGASGKDGEMGKPGTGGENGRDRPDLIKVKRMKQVWRIFGGRGWLSRKIAGYKHDIDTCKRGRFDIPEGLFGTDCKGHGRGFDFPPILLDEFAPEFNLTTFAHEGDKKLVQASNQKRKSNSVHSNSDILEQLRSVVNSEQNSTTHNDFVECYNQFAASVGDTSYFVAHTSKQTTISVVQIETRAQAIYDRQAADKFAGEKQENTNQQADAEETLQQLEPPSFDLYGINKFSVLQNNYFLKDYASLENAVLNYGRLDVFKAEFDLKTLKADVSFYNNCRTLTNLHAVLKTTSLILASKEILIFYLANDNEDFFIELAKLIDSLSICYKYLRTVPLVPNELIIDQVKLGFLPFPHVYAALNLLFKDRAYTVLSKSDLIKKPNIEYKLFLTRMNGIRNDSLLLISNPQLQNYIKSSLAEIHKHGNHNLFVFIYKLQVQFWTFLDTVPQTSLQQLAAFCTFIDKLATLEFRALKDVSIGIKQKIEFLKKLNYAGSRIESFYSGYAAEESSWHRAFELVRDYLLTIKPLHKQVLNSWGDRFEQIAVGNNLVNSRPFFHQEFINGFNNDLAAQPTLNANEQIDNATQLFNAALQYTNKGNYSLVDTLFASLTDNKDVVLKTHLACIAKARGYQNEAINNFLIRLPLNTAPQQIAAQFSEIENMLSVKIDPAVDKVIDQYLELIIARGLFMHKLELEQQIFAGQIQVLDFIDYIQKQQFANLDEKSCNAIKPYIKTVVKDTIVRGYKLYCLFDAKLTGIGSVVNYFGFFKEERLWDFLMSALSAEIFVKNIHDFGKVAFYNFCSTNYQPLIKLTSVIFEKNICHTHDLDKLDILVYLQQITSIGRYKNYRYQSELISIFERFNAYPLKSIVAFVMALNNCDENIVDIVTADLFLVNDLAEPVKLSHLYQYVNLISNPSSSSNLSVEELASLKEAIHYVNSKTHRLANKNAELIAKLEAGSEFAHKLEKAARRFGAEEKYNSYVVALYTEASEDLKSKLLDPSINIEETEKQIVERIFSQAHQAFKVDELEKYIEKNELTHYQEILGNLKALLADLKQAILTTKSFNLIAGIHHLCILLPQKLSNPVLINEYKIINEAAPLIFNVFNVEVLVAHLYRLDLTVWPQFLYTQSIHDLVTKIFAPNNEDSNSILNLLNKPKFTIHAKKALYNALLRFEEHPKLDLIEFKAILNVLADADISLLDSAHLFKETDLRNWLSKAQLFDVCKLIRAVQVDDIGHYSTINSAFYSIMFHDERSYSDVVEILNALIAKSQIKANRPFLAKIAETVYFSKIETAKIVNFINQDLLTAATKIEKDGISTQKAPALSTQELINELKAKNSKLELSKYIPIDNLVDMIEKIIADGTQLFNKIKNQAEFETKVTQMSEFSVLFSISDNDAHTRELQFRENIVPILACLVALYAKAKFDSKNEQIIAYNNQILSVIVGTYNEEFAKMQEIKTGEGKTLIVALTAAAFAVKKYQVDIVTSNRGLAEEGEHESQAFFKLLQLTCGRCCRVGDADANKQAFAKNIVYGTIDSFQNMILENRLRDVCEEFIERYKKPVHLLGDEADSVMVDRAGHMRYNSSNHPYFKLIDNLLTLIFSTVLGERYHIAAATDKDKIFKEIAQSVNFQIEQNKVFVPAELKDFCIESTKSWAQSAYSALYMSNMDNFIISSDGNEDKKQSVLIIDKRTGYEEYSTKWMNALTQYIEMINGLAKSEVSLKSNFISNYSFFRLYKNHISGYTGTVGDSYTIQKYMELYEQITFIIPSYRKSNLHVVSNTVTYGADEVDWFKAIDDEVARISKNQPIEIVCENVDYANKVSDRLQKQASYKIDHYFLDEHKDRIKLINEQKTYGVEGMTPKQILITTNRGGRGTDLKINHKIAAHGLHVMETFMAETVRDDKQILGRTARNGNPGTASYVINLPNADLSQSKIENYFAALTLRDDKDKRRLHNDVYIKTPAFLLEESLNQLFVACHKELSAKLETTKYQDCILAKQQQDLILHNLATTWSIWLNSAKEDINAISQNINFEDNRNDILAKKGEVIKATFVKKFEEYMAKVRANEDLLGDINILALGSQVWLRLADTADKLELPKVELSEEQRSEMSHDQQQFHLIEKVREREEKQQKIRAAFKRLCIYNSINLKEPTGAAHLKAATLYDQRDKKKAIYHLKEARYLLLNQFNQISSGKEGFNLLAKYMNRKESPRTFRKEQLSDHEKIIGAHIAVADYLAGKKLNVNDIKKMVLDVIDEKNQKQNDEDTKKLRNELVELLEQKNFVTRDLIRKKWQDTSEKNSRDSRGYGDKFTLAQDLAVRLQSLSEYVKPDILQNYIMHKSKNERKFLYKDIEQHVKTYEGFIACLKHLNIISAASKTIVTVIDTAIIPRSLYRDQPINFDECVAAIVKRFNLQKFEANKLLIISKDDLPVLKEIGCEAFYNFTRDKDYLKEEVESYTFNPDVNYVGMDFGIFNEAKFFDAQLKRDLSIVEYITHIKGAFDNKLLANEVLFRPKKEAEIFILGYLHGQDILKDKFNTKPLFPITRMVANNQPGTRDNHQPSYYYETLPNELEKFKVSESELQGLYDRTLAQLREIQSNYNLSLADYVRSNLVGTFDVDYKSIDYFYSLSLNEFLTLDIQRDNGWKLAATILALVGILEIVIGCILVYTVAAAPLGVFLINEGISDLMYAYSVFMTERFDINEYMMHKVISMFINAVAAGMRAQSPTPITVSSVLTTLAVSYAVSHTLELAAQESLYKCFDQIKTDLKTDLANHIIGDLKELLVSIAAHFDEHQNAKNDIDVLLDILNVNDPLSELRAILQNDYEGKFVSTASTIMKSAIANMKASDADKLGYRCLVYIVGALSTIIRSNQAIQSAIRNVGTLKDQIVKKIGNLEERAKEQKFQETWQRIMREEFGSENAGAYNLKQHYEHINRQIRDFVDNLVERSSREILSIPMSEISAYLTDKILQHMKDENNQQEREKKTMMGKIQKAVDNNAAKEASTEISDPNQIKPNETDDLASIKKAQNPVKVKPKAKPNAKSSAKANPSKPELKKSDEPKAFAGEIKKAVEKEKANEHKIIQAKAAAQAKQPFLKLINDPYKLWENPEWGSLTNTIKIGNLWLNDDGIVFDGFSLLNLTYSNKFGEDVIQIKHSLHKIDLSFPNIFSVSVTDPSPTIGFSALYAFNKIEGEVNVVKLYNMFGYNLDLNCTGEAYIGGIGAKMGYSNEFKDGKNQITFKAGAIHPALQLGAGMECKLVGSRTTNITDDTRITLLGMMHLYPEKTFEKWTTQANTAQMKELEAGMQQHINDSHLDSEVTNYLFFRSISSGSELLPGTVTPDYVKSNAEAFLDAYYYEQQRKLQMY